MKRISLIILGGLALVLLVSAYAKTPTQQTSRSTRGQEPKRDTLLTPDMQREYVQLTKSGAREKDVRSWARKHKLQIVSLKNYDIIVIPEQGFQNPTVQEATNCDASKCPVATGSYSITNTLGKVTGYQAVRCKAGSCKWVKDAQGRNQRICEAWKCENEGPPISID